MGMRGVARVGAVWIASACASEGFPPGGPEDLAPPVVIETSPADRAVNAEPGQAIVLRFDEKIEHRQARQISQFFRVNPDVPEFDAVLDGEVVTLTSQDSMIDGVTYMVTVLPGLRDRDGNATVTPRTILFSVGGEEPITLSVVRVRIVADTLPAAGARYRLENEESGFGYTMEADSQGRVEAEAVEYGRYIATAWQEEVRPDGWQMTEEPGARDTFELSLDDRAHESTYQIAVVDTTAPVIVRVETHNSRLLTAEFDDRLPKLDEIAPRTVRLYEGALGLATSEARLDTLPLDEVRRRRIDVDSVVQAGPKAVQVTPREPLVSERVYRVEAVGISNASGVASTSEGGLTFRAEYSGPAVFESEELPWLLEVP